MLVMSHPFIMFMHHERGIHQSWPSWPWFSICASSFLRIEMLVILSATLSVIMSIMILSINDFTWWPIQLRWEPGCLGTSLCLLSSLGVIVIIIPIVIITMMMMSYRSPSMPCWFGADREHRTASRIWWWKLWSLLWVWWWWWLSCCSMLKNRIPKWK